MPMHEVTPFGLIVQKILVRNMQSSRLMVSLGLANIGLELALRQSFQRALILCKIFAIYHCHGIAVRLPFYQTVG
jgi:hypothetical protein